MSMKKKSKTFDERPNCRGGRVSHGGTI